MSVDPALELAKHIRDMLPAKAREALLGGGTSLRDVYACGWRAGRAVALAEVIEIAALQEPEMLVKLRAMQAAPQFVIAAAIRALAAKRVVVGRATGEIEAALNPKGDGNDSS